MSVLPFPGEFAASEGICPGGVGVSVVVAAAVGVGDPGAGVTVPSAGDGVPGAGVRLPSGVGVPASGVGVGVTVLS